ncbi:MAG: type I secretion system permease/ATPase [Alphaproteobacteria bacterium]|nr:type I secretion system permease/ATPase [Alphaproteobacteria bacterium]MCD8520417.1 type I secretion system permease/ATPase [Alphaproteobacteria bacterium]
MSSSDNQKAPDDSSPIPNEASDPQDNAGQIASGTSASKGQSANVPDDWPLQADRMALHRPLVDALVILAGHYGRRTSAASLTAGLPIPKKGITPLLFIRAAERADLTARLAERSLESLAIAPNLPCILSLEDNQACILWEVNSPHTPRKGKKSGKLEAHPETSFVVQFPETADEKQTLNLEDLKKIYTGYAFFARPVARTDDRAGPAEIEEGKDWFWAALKKNKVLYSEVGIAAVMINMFGVAGSLFIMNVYDRVVPNKAFETLWALAIGVGIVYLFDFLLRNLRSTFLDVAGRRADVKISASLFEQILGMTMTSRPASAGVLASNMREFETLRDFFTSATMTALVDLPFVFIYIAVIAIVAGPLAFVPLAAIPLIVGMGFYLQGPLQKVIRQSLNESALKNALLFETIVGLETIKVQAAEGYTQRSWEELSDKASRTSIKSRKLSSFAQNWALFIQQLVSVVIVIVGVYLIADGYMTQGALIASVILSGRAMGPLGQVAGLMTRLNQSRESLRQLDELMKKPVERPAGKHFVSLPHIRGLVDFQDIVFHYPGQSVPAVNHMSFRIEPGEKVGVIGAVGSGKTTLERLLLNLYQPDSGSVQIDGTDVRQIAPGDLRRNVGAVQQSPQLFFGTVRENITMGHETAPDRAVMKAAELSGVLEFLADTSAGLDTQVGERGEALSGGQRQAVAIARALLYDPPIMILDEPTASMDPASENRLKKRLGHLCKNKTTILITHKGAMLNIVDKLILIDRGKLVAFGPKEEVIRKLQARQYGTAAENTEV